MQTCVALLPDYASESTDKLPLQKVGINNLSMWRLDPSGDRVLTNQSAYVNLDDHKGIHMSRLVEVLMECDGLKIELDNDILYELASSHEVNNAYWECKWQAMWEIDEVQTIRFGAHVEGVLTDEEISWYLTSIIPYTSVCPCSAAMVREYGGIPHMQRATAKITGRIPSDSDLDELMTYTLIGTLDAVGLYPKPLMKRPDELEWCQRAAERNLFVEDATREIVNAIRLLYSDYVVVCEHEESIHQHNAVAVCRKGEKLL